MLFLIGGLFNAIGLLFYYVVGNENAILLNGFLLIFNAIMYCGEKK